MLIVEDDEDVRETMALVLQADGVRTVGAVDGVDALERLDAGERPALILLDLRMPRLNGVDFMKAIRCHPERALIPVVVVSGDGRVHEAARTMGASGCLVKPFDLDELVDTVRRFTGPCTASGAPRSTRR